MTGRYHRWQDEAELRGQETKEERKQFRKAVATDSQVPCDRCNDYATKKEILAGDSKFLKIGDYWLCRDCQVMDTIAKKRSKP